MTAEELVGRPAGVDPRYPSPWRAEPACNHPKDALHIGHFEVISAEQWVCQVLCTRCFAVFREHNIPNKVLGKIWLRQYEGHYGIIDKDHVSQEKMSRNIADARAEMLAMIKMLGVDPNNPDGH